MPNTLWFSDNKRKKQHNFPVLHMSIAYLATKGWLAIPWNCFKNKDTVACPEKRFYSGYWLCAQVEGTRAPRFLG